MPPDRLSGYLFSNAVRPVMPSKVRAARSRRRHGSMTAQENCVIDNPDDIERIMLSISW
jgi:hypothetical protein